MLLQAVQSEVRGLALALEREEEEVARVRSEERRREGERGQDGARLGRMERRMNKVISEEHRLPTQILNTGKYFYKKYKYNHKHLTKKMMQRWMEEEEERRGQLEDRVGQLQDQVKLLEKWKMEGRYDEIETLIAMRYLKKLIYFSNSTCGCSEPEAGTNTNRSGEAGEVKQGIYICLLVFVFENYRF